MKRRLVASLAAIVAATATILTASGAAAATPDVTTAGAPDVGTANAKLPAAIQVDETQNKVVASFVGIGKQVYDCNTGGPFTFREPVAGLLSRGVQAAIHGKGPFWASFDGSRVEASGVGNAPSPDPARSIATAILGGGVPLSQVWVFILAPVVGALLAGFTWKALFARGK